MKLTCKVTSAALILGLLACSSGLSLNPYQGSLKDLLLDEVGEYKRQEWNITTDQPGIPLSGIGAIDTAMAGYVKSDYVPQKGDRPGKNPNYLAFMVANFPTTDKAILGLQKLKEELPRGLHIRLKEQGPKKKHGKEIGERITGYDDSPWGTKIHILWTDGSVLFYIHAYEDAGLRFEQDYPH